MELGGHRNNLFTYCQNSFLGFCKFLSQISRLKYMNTNKFERKLRIHSCIMEWSRANIMKWNVKNVRSYGWNIILKFSIHIYFLRFNQISSISQKRSPTLQSAASLNYSLPSIPVERLPNLSWRKNADLPKRLHRYLLPKTYIWK